MVEEYVNYIKEFDIGNAEIYKILFDPSITQTTKLMTSLRYGVPDSEIYPRENNFNVLAFRMYQKTKFLIFDYGHLVMIYVPSSIRKKFEEKFDLSERKITFTDFKKNTIYKIQGIFKYEKHTTLPLSNGESLELWDTPYVLRAVTDYDKDFKKIYINGELIYEGNNYGDCSEFYIIGTMGKSQIYDRIKNESKYDVFYED